MTLANPSQRFAEDHEKSLITENPFTDGTYPIRHVKTRLADTDWRMGGEELERGLGFGLSFGAKLRG